MGYRPSSVDHVEKATESPMQTLRRKEMKSVETWPMIAFNSKIRLFSMKFAAEMKTVYKEFQIDVFLK